MVATRGRILDEFTARKGEARAMGRRHLMEQCSSTSSEDSLHWKPLQTQVCTVHVQYNMYYTVVWLPHDDDRSMHPYCVDADARLPVAADMMPVKTNSLRRA